MSTQSLLQLDLSAFHAGGTQRSAFLQQLRCAARDAGFFYLTGHGVPDSLQRQVLDIARQFFALPDASKQRVAMLNSPHFRGHTRAGSELTQDKADWREQFDIMREADRRKLHYGDRPWLRLQGPNQWPAELPQMKDIMLRWQDRLTDIALSLLQAFAISLGQDADVFAHTVSEGPFQHLKLIRYPGRDHTDSEQGVGAHKDAGYLTLLLQDGQAGLEVLTGGQWVLASPRPGTLIVKIGELLELASSGYLKATLPDKAAALRAAAGL